MNNRDLKYVVGEVRKNEPAIIRFFGAVDEWSTRNFNDEFLWLQDCVKPSKIIVMINSEGGSVINGMSTFSVIQSCPIETDCIIEGIAASMGSVIWAAGKNLYMHDYSLLMIHNPFCGNVSEDEDPKIKQVIKAFKAQIATIYQRRFGLSKDRVKKIMDGEEDEDGTFLTAENTVEEGIIKKSHVIKTSKHLYDEICSKTVGIDDYKSLRDVMSSILNKIDEKELIEQVSSIYSKDNHQHNETQMDNKETVMLSVVKAALGFNEGAEAPFNEVSARITALVKAESDLKAVRSELDEMKIKLAGKEAEVVNLKSESEKISAELKKYKEAEEVAKEAVINDMIEDAIKTGKIKADAKKNWIEMAHTNLDMVKSALASIPESKDIINEIANDHENVDSIKETLDTVDKKVRDVVGDFKFAKFN